MAGEAEKKGKTYRAYECDNALPFGYTYDSYIPREKYEKMSVIEKQQALLQFSPLMIVKFRLKLLPGKAVRRKTEN